MGAMLMKTADGPDQACIPPVTLSSSSSRLLRARNQPKASSMHTEVGLRVDSGARYPKATFRIQVLAPYFVILEQFLHHFCQCVFI